MNDSTVVYAHIIVPLYLPNTYTWRIPPQLQHQVKVGFRVEVQLRNRKYAGIVKSFTHEKPKAFTPKDIISVLDDNAVIYPLQLQFWQWMADYYMCTEGEIMQVALPANLKLSSESILIWNEFYGTDYTDLDNDEYLIAEALEIRKELKMTEIQALLDKSNVYPVIKRLIDKQVCFVWESLVEKYKAKTDTFITLHPLYHKEEELSNLFNVLKAPKQTELLLAFLHLQKTEGIVTQAPLLKKSNATATQLKALCDKNILIAQKKPIDRISYLSDGASNIEVSLSVAQQTAYEQINQLLTAKNVCLLHGVTASGKTLIYIKLIEQYIAQQQQALFLLPEIALTAQIIKRLQVYFGSSIAVYHSKFNPNERVEIWNKVKTNEIKIVLGARSALFLPFKNLGLIIVDEEHDTSYKQQSPAPRYHARDAAIYYASLFKAKVLLGSATPSIESYYNATQEKYGLVTLSERFDNVALPATNIIQMAKINNTGNDKQVQQVFTPPLADAIKSALDKHEQVILFQNRRGYSPYLLCQNCGWIPQCVQCDVTLTFHKSHNKLKCHYCGSGYPIVQTCAACGSHHFLYKNFGTEKIEELVTEQFPDARVARMDLDTIKGKHSHETLIQQFEQRKVDILVGTQMVVKGLDFEHVSVVGIVDGDGVLNFTDFRVNERAFQLMEQVSGRAGRKHGNGQVYIQVSNVQHPVLQFVQAHNYAKLYQYEINMRSEYQYPPFTRLIQVNFRHKNNQICEEAARIFADMLQKQFGSGVFGPAQPPIEWVRNLYIWEVLIKIPRNTSIINACKQSIRNIALYLQTHPLYKTVMIQPDVDPA